jgi:23S rRNA pseudouridine2457 synthase
LQLTEGKNRQVRKMTASVGLPTLRLIRAKIGNLEIGQLQPGEVIEIDYLMAKKGLM